MKPIIIYPENNSDKVILTKKEFEEYLRQAYDAGHTDGYAAGKTGSWWNMPITLTPYEYTTTNPNKFDPYKITCDAHNDL